MSCKMVACVDVEALWLLRSRLRALLSTNIQEEDNVFAEHRIRATRGKSYPCTALSRYIWSASRQQHATFHASRKQLLLFLREPGVLLITAAPVVARTSPRPTANQEATKHHSSTYYVRQGRSRLIREPSTPHEREKTNGNKPADNGEAKTEDSRLVCCCCGSTTKARDETTALCSLCIDIYTSKNVSTSF